MSGPAATGSGEDKLRPPSPCIRRCTLDYHNVCLGCLRTLDEIVAWSTLTASQQHELLRELATRRA